MDKQQAPKESLEALDRVGIVGVAFKETRKSQITTQWGVDWDSWYIARDLLQNFYDANKDNVSDIDITRQGRTIYVDAPIPFDLNHLFFIGSHKGEDDVGQYGEGFKVASVCLLRKHGLAPIARSGRDVLRIRLADTWDEGTQLQPLAYDFFSGTEEFVGSRLILEGCGDDLAKALQDGLQNFFYEGNPLLKHSLYEDRSDRFRLYSAPTPSGHIFYRRLKRGEIPRIPLSITINKKYAALEKLIAHDRDRKAFDKNFQEEFYKVFARNFAGSERDLQAKIVVAAKDCWKEGHPLLAAVAKEGWEWSKDLLKDTFGEDHYFARSNISRDISRKQQIGKIEQIEQIEALWRQEGRTELPAYFSHFGLMTAKSHIDEMERRAQEEEQQRKTHPPTVAEGASIRLLHEVMKDLTPEVSDLFTYGHTVYTVGASETVLGSLREGRGYQSHEIFLHESLFISDLGKALSVFLHEHNHIFGSDGNRRFSDALTHSIEGVVRNRTRLDDYDDRWQKAVLSVQNERNAEPKRRAKTKLKKLAKTAKVHDVTSPIGAQWDAMQ